MTHIPPGTAAVDIALPIYFHPIRHPFPVSPQVAENPVGGLGQGAVG